MKHYADHPSQGHLEVIQGQNVDILNFIIIKPFFYISILLYLGGPLPWPPTLGDSLWESPLGIPHGAISVQPTWRSHPGKCITQTENKVKLCSIKA